MFFNTTFFKMFMSNVYAKYKKYKILIDNWLLIIDKDMINDCLNFQFFNKTVFDWWWQQFKYNNSIISQH